MLTITGTTVTRDEVWTAFCLTYDTRLVNGTKKSIDIIEMCCSYLV
jgi:hypothetical protein